MQGQAPDKHTQYFRAECMNSAFLLLCSDDISHGWHCIGVSRQGKSESEERASENRFSFDKTILLEDKRQFW